jgi:hypothetical protein
LVIGVDLPSNDLVGELTSEIRGLINLRTYEPLYCALTS